MAGRIEKTRYLAQIDSAQKLKTKNQTTNIPSEIPKKWIEKAVKHFKDPCWCAATFLVLQDYLKDTALHKLSKSGIEKLFKTVIEEIRQAKWDMSSYLSQEGAGAALKTCTEQKDGDCIIVNRVLYPSSFYGDRPGIPGTPIQYRDLVLPHEGLHKLLNEMGIDNSDYKNGFSEDKAIGRIGEIYYTQELSERTSKKQETAEVSACQAMGPCARTATEKEGQNKMAPPLKTDAGSQKYDFNNDRILDFLAGRVGSKVKKESDGSETHLTIFRENVPHLNGDPAGQDATRFISFDVLEECVLPGHLSGTVAWGVNRFSNRLVPQPHFRFFNKDHSMSFIPGQKVKIRGEDHSRVIESVALLLDKKTNQQAGPTYAVFSDCTAVPIDLLTWVANNEETLDLREVLKKPVKTQMHATSTEEVAGQLIQSVREIATGQAGKTAQEKRDLVIGLARKSVMDRFLPPGWEASLLFAYGLPQKESVPFVCDGPCCRSDVE